MTGNNPAKRIETLASFENRNRLFYDKEFPYQGDSHYRAKRVRKDWNTFKMLINYYDQRQGPRVGDFLRLGEERYLQFTYDWDDSIQTTPGDGVGRYGSFAFGQLTDLISGTTKGSYISYSGSLDRGVSKSNLYQVPEGERLGLTWIFSNDDWGANRAIYCYVPFRIFKIKEER